MATMYSPYDCVAGCRRQSVLSFAIYMVYCAGHVLVLLPSLFGAFAEIAAGVQLGFGCGDLI